MSQRQRAILGVLAALVVVALGYVMADRLWLSKRVDEQKASATESAASPEQSSRTLAISDKSVVVLPFVDMSEGQDQEYMADGIAEELLNGFANTSTSASQPLVVSVPHRLSRWEALRRVKSGLESIKANYGFLFAMQEETWTGYHLNFRVSVLGQAVYGSIDVRQHFVSLRAFLPWLLAGLAEAAVRLFAKKAHRFWKESEECVLSADWRPRRSNSELMFAEQPYGRRLRALVSGFVGERHARANLQVENASSSTLLRLK